MPAPTFLRATRSAPRSLLTVAAIILLCGGGSDSTRPGGGSDQTATFTLREFGSDGALPFTFHDGSDYKLDLTGGSLTLRDDHSFDLRLDFSVTINGQTSSAPPWGATGQWSVPEADHFDLHSAAFGEDDPARGLFNTVEDGSPDVLNGNLHAGLEVILPLRFVYPPDGITYGLDTYAFQ